MTEEKDRLETENSNFKHGLKVAGPETDLSNPNAVAEELKRVQRKNDSLKRENEIIRRELASFKDKFGQGKTFQI